jgi:hypothetical protein
MEELQQHMYVEGSVASVFAQQVTKEQLASQDSGHKFARTFSDMFRGSKNLDPGVVEAALGASEARGYLLVMNDDRGLSLVHHLAQLDWELCPGNPIVNKIVAFGDNIHKDATTPNVWVFEGEEHELFFRLHLPNINLNEMQLFYSNKAEGNDTSSLFAMDLANRGVGPGASHPVDPNPNGVGIPVH